MSLARGFVCSYDLCHYRRRGNTMKKEIKLIIAAAVIVCIVAFCLIYTSPRTIEQRYPFLDLSKCTKIEGHYSAYPESDTVTCSIYPGTPFFKELINHIRFVEFNKKLKNILPQPRITIHNIEKGDYQWEIMLFFDDVIFPDGSSVSGSILSIRYFYGDLSYSIDGKTIYCSVKKNPTWDAWVKNVITNNYRYE